MLGSGGKYEECSVVYTNSGQLKSHSRIHSGEKPYKCNTCLAIFTQAFKLRKHYKMHWGDKPYKCECMFTQCDKLSTKNMF